MHAGTVEEKIGGNNMATIKLHKLIQNVMNIHIACTLSATVPPLPSIKFQKLPSE